MASFETCVTKRLATSGGGMVAEASARKACREQFPWTPEEAETMRKMRENLSSTGASATGPTGVIATTGQAGATGTTGSAAAGGSSSLPVSIPPPTSVPAPSTPSAMPGASGGNPMGGPPGLSKK